MSPRKTTNRPLDRLKTFLHGFTERQLDQYTQAVTTRGSRSSGKEVNDAVWGTIALSPVEVLIIDSPLLQRLRTVRQIGVSHWVYPSSGHTRFEHTLGVLHQTRALVSSLNHFASTSSKIGEVITPDYAQVLRIAALMHDCGHGVFSHVSENSLMRFDFYRRAVAALEDEIGSEVKKLSEVCSYLIVGSPAFRRLLMCIEKQVDAFPHLLSSPAENVQIVQKTVADAIVGASIHPRIPQLQELINGPFDADKLDYLTRDSKLSGVPTLVDISRLSQKLAAKRVPLSDVPAPLAETLDKSTEHAILIGIRSSGAAVLDELHLGRAMLFTKIYRHQKIKALESMIDALFSALGEAIPPERLIDVTLGFGDDEFLSLSGATVVAALRARSVNPRASGRKSLQTALDIAMRLRQRDLFVRAFVIQPRYPSDSLEGRSTQLLALQSLVTNLSDPDFADRFRRKIADEVIEILRVCDPDSLTAYEERGIQYYITLVPPNQPSGGTEIDRALLFPVGERPVHYSESIFNTGNWSRFYAATDGAAGYLFSPRDIAVFVHAAAEVVLYESYNILVPESALELAKHHPNDVQRVKRSLAAGQYYRDKSHYIRPYPERLSRGDIPSRIEKIATKLAIYQAPSEDDEQFVGMTLSDRIEFWLRQFEDDARIECAMEALDQLTVLGRDKLNAGLKAFFEANAKFRGAVICGLGSLKDSGSVTGYYARDLGREYISDVVAVQDIATVPGNTPIVFVDDVLGSGNQAADILGNWFDDEKLKRSLGEKRLPLFEEGRQALRDRDIAFVFGAGWDEGAAALRKAMGSLGLHGEVYCSMGDESIPFAFTGKPLHSNPTAVAEFESFCRTTGAALLRSSGHSEEKCAERALGYGNRGMLLVTANNAPTQSLTCLWLKGKVDGVPWLPLLSRRKKE